MRNFYDFVSYTPSTDNINPGVAAVRVIGCNVPSQFDVPIGCVQDDPTWQNTVAKVIASILDVVDPKSVNYDSTLDNWANETE